MRKPNGYPVERGGVYTATPEEFRNFEAEDAIDLTTTKGCSFSLDITLAQHKCAK